MYGYLLGLRAGLPLEKMITKYSREFKSHRRVPETDSLYTFKVILLCYSMPKFDASKCTCHGVN